MSRNLIIIPQSDISTCTWSGTIDGAPSEIMPIQIADGSFVVEEMFSTYPGVPVNFRNILQSYPVVFKTDQEIDGDS